MDKALLSKTAAAMVAKGRGILAADESSGTCEKRFKSVGVECTEENRRTYRNLLFSTSGVEQFLSGVILFDETARQKANDGSLIPEYLAKKGIIPGIKVDKGTVQLPLAAAGELVTEGLDGLRERLKEYRALGARFAKWRAVIRIGETIPSPRCVSANAHALARYATLCQEQGLVPIALLQAFEYGLGRPRTVGGDGVVWIAPRSDEVDGSSHRNLDLRVLESIVEHLHDDVVTGDRCGLAATT